jgi:hypothetical protein
MNHSPNRRRFLTHAAITATATAMQAGVVWGSQGVLGSSLEVEAEEEVYKYISPNNGADPMWCYGSTCLVRIRDEVFASGLETVNDAAPLNNCRWQIFRRSEAGWRLWFTDAAGRTREPAPIVAFPNGPLFVSANPTQGHGAEPRGGPTRPEIFEFDPSMVPHQHRRHTPTWAGAPRFTEHSYRSFAADGANRHAIIFQNIGYSHAEWAFRNELGRWSSQGQLHWPWGADYERPQSIRICYPTVALANRSVHFCGVSDIAEPNSSWRDFKRKQTGQEWDYDLRRLFYTWCPEVGRSNFERWVEIASCERFGGRIVPGDLWVGPDNLVHLLWTERAIDTRLRPKYFPSARQMISIQYAVLNQGKVISRSTIAQGEEGRFYENPWGARFHLASDRLYAVWHVSGVSRAGAQISENRLVELRDGATQGTPRTIPLRTPLIRFFTVTPRGGSAPYPALEMLGQPFGDPNAIRYARIRLT